MRRCASVACLLVALAASTALADAARALSYSMQILVPIEQWTKAYDLNESGMVVGWAGATTPADPDGTLVPARWVTPATPESLGLLDPNWGYGYGYADAINEHGEIVGYSGTPAGDRGFRWSEATGMDPVEVVSGEQHGSAAGINDLGEIALDWGGGAWLYEPDGTSISLGALNAEGRAQPIDISNTMVVGGSFSDSAGTGRGFVWTRAHGMQPLPGLDEDGWSTAFAANDRGDVVGMAGYDGGGASRRAFLWNEQDGIRDLGTGPERESFATDVNEHGQVVGVVLTMSARARASLWDPDLGFIDLNDVVVGLGELMLDEAVAINDRGQIAANGILHGARLGVLLTPIPEPSCVLLVGAGIAWLAARRRAA